MEGCLSIETAKAEIRKIDRDLDMLVNLILRRGGKINAKVVALEARKKELEKPQTNRRRRCIRPRRIITANSLMNCIRPCGKIVK